MSAEPAAKTAEHEARSQDINRVLTTGERLSFARKVVLDEGHQLVRLARRMDESIVHAAAKLLECQGSVIVTGIGKAGIIGQKLSATLCSTGTRSHFLHSAEAVHGDLGKVQTDDLVIVLSHSGKTEEIVRLLPSITEQSGGVIAITASQVSPLGKAADIVLELGETQEACELGLAPSTSTTAMVAIGDALALLTSHLREFTAEDFAKYHPGGNLGLKLSNVDQVMRPLQQCRVASDMTTVREVLAISSRAGRRAGAVMLTNSEGKLSGIFTDSDLSRLLERRRDSALDGPIADVMTRGPSTVTSNQSLSEAINILAERKISELPVVCEEGFAVGMIDITDVVGMMPSETEIAEPKVIPFRPAG